MSNPNNHLLETIKGVVLTPIHRTGWMFIAIFAVVSLILGMLWEPLGLIGLVLTAWCAYFFRDPERVTPIHENFIISPADGKIQAIAKVVPPAELGLGDEERMRVSIFLNLFDVHVNRIPHEGTITKLHYIPGKFLNADLDKASEENERMLIQITLPNDQQMGLVQIAGMVARRIVCDLKEGQPVKTGERFGIIRFGSRADIYLPEGATALVIEGQRSVGGETILADLSSDEPLRMGTKR